MSAIKPLVFKKDRKQRLGKGFSLSELKGVNLSLKQALKLEIPVDSRRKTVHEENVEALRKFLAAKEVAKSKTKRKAVKGKGKSKSGGVKKSKP
jgi:ribosomal protein L13E